MTARRLAVAVKILALLALLFLPAGTLRWWRAWVLIATMAMAWKVSRSTALRDRDELLAERSKGFQPGQPRADKIAVSFLIAAYVFQLLLIPLDVFHLHLLPKPGIILSSAGMLLFLLGWTVVTLSFRVNNFAVPAVRCQPERHQVVIDIGMYGIVRHPLYAGMLMMFVGAPLWLESTTAAIFALAHLSVLAVRIGIEEDFLRRNLAGYEDYMRRVRYRLLPFVW
jgi:protein-S-isoprenylcysteine O-methyltransferase Ste14